jgi:putative transcriptional regulator
MSSKKTSTKHIPEDRRILEEMMEMAQALHGHGLISKQDMTKMNLICESPPHFTPESVTSIRVEKAKVSQSVFASMLNVSVSAVQKWESPSSGKHPSGAAAKLLQLIEKRGLEAILV